MARKETREVPISQLKTSFFVRKALNQNHVLYLAELYEAGAEIAAPTVTPELEIIDGRHRKEAADLAGRKTMKVIVEHPETRAEAIVSAISANLGGALPPSPADIQFAIEQLIKEGVSDRKIMDMVSQVMPRSVVRKHLTHATSHLNGARVNAALTAITEEGLTVPAAAERFGVDEDKIRDVLRGRKKKAAAGTQVNLKTNLTRRFQGHSIQNGKMVSKLLMAYEDGEIQAKTVEDLLNHLSSLIGREEKSLDDWRNRFTALRADMKTRSEAMEAGA